MLDMVTQLSFEFEEFEDKTGEQTPRIRPQGGMPMPIEVVDAFLERMTRNPEKFADGLGKIRKKFGSVLLPRQMVSEIQCKAAELQEMVEKLTTDGRGHAQIKYYTGV